jgi:hypothetical protein
MPVLHAVAILVIAIGELPYANDAAAKTAGVTGEMNNDILTNWIGSR